MVETISLGRLGLNVEFTPQIQDGGIGGTYYGSSYHFDSYPEIRDIDVDGVWIDNKEIKNIKEKNIIRIRKAVEEQICLRKMIKELEAL